MSDIKVGDMYFIFDENNRVYATNSCGGPIYQKHFVPVKVISETSRSWITDRYGIKVPKANPWNRLFTQHMVDDAVWVYENRVRIADKVIVLRGPLLRQVAEIIGYEELSNE
jgi:hypothetical protein